MIEHQENQMLMEHKQIAHHFAKQGKMNILNAIPIITQKHSQHHIRAVTGLKEN